MKRVFTGERLETTVFDKNAVSHLHRYSIANNYIKNKVVLDIASGEGYGSHLMAQGASYVYGVDIDNLSIEHAKEKYKKNNLEFLVGNTSKIPLQNNSVDVVVSFETLEHHDRHEEMFLEIKRVLKPHGICVISTPDKHYYSDQRNYKNKYHVKELYKNEFVELIENYFGNLQLLTQSYYSENSIIIEDTSTENLVFYSGDFNNLKTEDSYPNFLFAIASDADFDKQKNSIFDGSQLLSKKQQQVSEKIFNSNSYRTGHIILLPLKYIKLRLKKFKWHK